MSYQPLATVAHAFPVMVLPLGEKRAQLKVTPDDLRRNLRARTHAKLLLLNSPTNPTGRCIGSRDRGPVTGLRRTSDLLRATCGPGRTLFFGSS